MRVAVYTIAKNEEAMVDGWADSARDADFLSITDTGSTDGTVEQAIRLGVEVEMAHVHPFRFDEARNAALSLLPDDIDVCISLDMDERLAPGWRDALEAAYEGATRWRYDYVWSWDGGRPDVAFRTDKIHARHGYTWRYPCHEELFRLTGDEVIADTDVSIHHHADPDKRRDYLPLLTVGAFENPNDPRPTYYLARELMFAGETALAIEWFKRHLEMGSGWPVERAESARNLARLTGETDWLRVAVRIAPNRRESWLDLAASAYREQRWGECFDAARRGLAVTDRSGDYLTTKAGWGFELDDFAGIAAWNLGLRNEALAHGRKALLLNPYEQRLADNVAMYEEAVR